MVANSDSLGRISFQGFRNTAGLARTTAVEIEVQAHETGDGASTPGLGGKLIFSTAADTATSTTQRMTIDNTGSMASTCASAGTCFHVADQTTTQDAMTLSADGLTGGSALTVISAAQPMLRDPWFT